MKHGTGPSLLLALALASAQNACAVEAAPAAKASDFTDGGARKPKDPATKAVHAPPA